MASSSGGVVLAAPAPPPPALPSQHPLAPAGSGRFRPARARELVGCVLRARLGGASYSPDKASAWAREVADEIKAALKGEGWCRYKFVVQVLIGEQRGEGCRMASRCFWDAEHDMYCYETLKTHSLFCVAFVCAAYTY